MPSRTAVWRGFDAPRMEIAHIAFRSGSFEAVLELDADGIVTRYEGLAELVG